MAIFGMHKILVPPRRVKEIDAALRAHGMHLRRVYDATEGGYIDVLCIGDTGSRPTHGLGTHRAHALAPAGR